MRDIRCPYWRKGNTLGIAMARSRLSWIVVAGALAVLAACGSTAQPQGAAQSVASLSSDGLRVPDASSADQPSSAAAPSSAVRGALSAPSDTADPAAPASGGSPDAPAPAASGAERPTSGPGFTEDEIYIGYLTWNDVSAAGSAIGYAVDYGDQERIGQAIADDLNARGGIAGRKVVLAFYDYPTTEDGAAADQAACTKFTEDQRVFAVIAVTGPSSEVLPQCLHDRQVTLVANDNIPYPRYWFEQWAPFIYSTANPMTERLAPVWLQRSDAVGYFESWDTAAGAPGVAPVKVGVIRADAQSGEAFRDAVAAGLAPLGHAIEIDFALGSAFDAAGMNNAVLQFRSAGVTHVIVESLFLVLFPQAAESQGYRPRYTVTTGNAPLLVQSATPPQQLAGALGVGYFPSYDVANGQDPGDPSPSAAHCREIQQAAGNDPQQRESWNLQTKACDAFALIAEAARLEGLHTLTIANGAARITSLAPAGAFAVSFGPGRQDGPGAVRDVAYDVECECFTFTSPTNHPL